MKLSYLAITAFFGLLSDYSFMHASAEKSAAADTEVSLKRQIGDYFSGISDEVTDEMIEFYAGQWGLEGLQEIIDGHKSTLKSLNKPDENTKQEKARVSELLRKTENLLEKVIKATS